MHPLLLLLLAGSAAAASLEGIVADGSGAAIPGAAIAVRLPNGPEVARVRSDSAGGFHLDDLPGNGWILQVKAQGFEPAERALRDGFARITLTIAPSSSHVSVTAKRGFAQQDDETMPVVAIRTQDSALASPAPTIGHWLADAPGILIQQSTPSQVSPFLRGLAGYQVINLIDGVRFNNTTFRSGPNQYLAFVDPSQVSRLEAMLGPSSAQYGSDALGGAIQVITPAARYASDRSREFHGEATLFGATADRSAGGAAQTSIGTPRLAWLIGGSGRRHGDLRAGRGDDSRNVFRRYFGLSPAQIRGIAGGSRLRDTGFEQAALHTKFAARPASDQSLTLWYQRSAQYGADGYKDLLGGLGRLQSEFDPQALDFFYGRYEKIGLGRLDTLSGTVSLNQQTDGSARRNLRLSDPLTRDWNRLRSIGYSVQASAHAASRVSGVFGGDFYHEAAGSRRTIDGRPASPLYPDGARYFTGGLFGQGEADITRSLRVSFGGRFTSVNYEARRFRDWTWNTGLAWSPIQWLGFHVLAGRGFRAPNLNDLGATGLNDLGYELPAELAIPAGAIPGNSAGENATPLGSPVRKLRAESLVNYETGIRFSSRTFSGRVQVFTAGLDDPIVRRTLLFPADAIPSQLGGLAVSPIAPTAAQRAQGVSTVATTLDPRAVKAFVNDGQSRYSGVEALGRWAASPHWMLEARYSFLAGRDLNPNRNIRRLPPQLGSARLRYSAPGARWWLEARSALAGAQTRLSGGDIDDERIGASRRRSDIAAFFQGSRVAPLLDAAGRFTPTGETLGEIQDRVLPGVGDSVRVPLYATTAGWVSCSIHWGVPLGERVTVLAAIENAFDRNYRIHGSGTDAPGRNAYAAFRYVW